MPALSNKDKLRLKVAAKRLEKAKLDALKPWVRKKPIGSTIVCLGQDKPVLSYEDKDVIPSAPNKTRTSADKIANAIKLDGADKYQGRDGEYDHPSKLLCGDGEVYVPRGYKPRKDSPFKRAQAKACSVVIERKSL